MLTHCTRGHAWATCAFGLTLAGVLVALHYFPDDARLAQNQNQAAEEWVRLTSLVEAQNLEIEHLKVMAEVLKTQQSAAGLLAFGVDPADVRRRRTSQMDNLASRLLFHSPVGLLLYLLLFVSFSLYLGNARGHSEQEPTNWAAAERFRRERGIDQHFWTYVAFWGGVGAFCALTAWGLSWWAYRSEGEDTKCPECGKTFAAVTIHRSVKTGDLVLTNETVWQEVYDAGDRFRPTAYVATRYQPVLRQEHHVRDLLVCKFCWHCWSSSETVVA